MLLISRKKKTIWSILKGNTTQYIYLRVFKTDYGTQGLRVYYHWRKANDPKWSLYTKYQYLHELEKAFRPMTSAEKILYG